MELTSRVLGLIVNKTETRSVLVTADYRRLRQSIISALKPYPEAAHAVSAALGKLELEVAEDIKSSGKPLLLEAMPA